MSLLYPGKSIFFHRLPYSIKCAKKERNRKGWRNCQKGVKDCFQKCRSFDPGLLLPAVLRDGYNTSMDLICKNRKGHFVLLFSLTALAVCLFCLKTASAEGSGFSVDFGDISSGIIRVTAEKPIRLRVEKDGEDYRYDLQAGSLPVSIPLQMGEGSYTLIVYSHSEGGYERSAYYEADVHFDTPYAPFLQKNLYVDWETGGVCEKLTAAACDDCITDAQKLKVVYRTVCEAMEYDRVQAANETVFRVSYPDETLLKGKGVCWDSAVLLCTMLRSAGIPAKLVIGHYEPAGQNHAWVKALSEGKWYTADAVLGYLGTEPEGYTAERIY